MFKMYYECCASDMPDSLKSVPTAYPVFISLKTAPKIIHNFQKIIVENQGTNPGVFKCLFEMFGKKFRRINAFEYHIKEISGSNDAERLIKPLVSDEQYNVVFKDQSESEDLILSDIKIMRVYDYFLIEFSYRGKQFTFIDFGGNAVQRRYELVEGVSSVWLGKEDTEAKNNTYPMINTRNKKVIFLERDIDQLVVRPSSGLNNPFSIIEPFNIGSENRLKINTVSLVNDASSTNKYGIFRAITDLFCRNQERAKNTCREYAIEKITGYNDFSSYVLPLISEDNMKFFSLSDWQSDKDVTISNVFLKIFGNGFSIKFTYHNYDYLICNFDDGNKWSVAGSPKSKLGRIKDLYKRVATRCETIRKRICCEL